jgi:hypothetical protein
MICWDARRVWLPRSAPLPRYNSSFNAHLIFDTLDTTQQIREAYGFVSSPRESIRAFRSERPGRVG